MDQCGFYLLIVKLKSKIKLENILTKILNEYQWEV